VPYVMIVGGADHRPAFPRVAKLGPRRRPVEKSRRTARRSRRRRERLASSPCARCRFPSTAPPQTYAEKAAERRALPKSFPPARPQASGLPLEITFAREAQHTTRPRPGRLAANWRVPLTRPFDCGWHGASFGIAEPRQNSTKSYSSARPKEKELAGSWSCASAVTRSMKSWRRGPPSLRHDAGAARRQVKVGRAAAFCADLKKQSFPEAWDAYRRAGGVRSGASAAARVQNGRGWPRPTAGDVGERLPAWSNRQ